MTGREVSPERFQWLKIINVQTVPTASVPPPNTTRIFIVDDRMYKKKVAAPTYPDFPPRPCILDIYNLPRILYYCSRIHPHFHRFVVRNPTDRSCCGLIMAATKRSASAAGYKTYTKCTRYTRIEKIYFMPMHPVYTLKKNYLNCTMEK